MSLQGFSDEGGLYLWEGRSIQYSGQRGSLEMKSIPPVWIRTTFPLLFVFICLDTWYRLYPNRTHFVGQLCATGGNTVPQF